MGIGQDHHKLSKKITSLCYFIIGCRRIFPLCTLQKFWIQAFLDLEDGYYESINPGLYPKAIWGKFVKLNFDLFCSDGTLLACEQLGANIRNKNTLCYYGTIDNVEKNRKFTSKKIKVLMSGTINCKTGKDIFVKSIELLRTLKHKFVENLEFHICGQCDSSDFMERLSAEKIFPNVFYHGRL